MTEAPIVVVGGGHNGLVAACYLARAGRNVLVLEASQKLGGGSRTDETIPGYRFNTHAAAHNIINMTSIPAELDLADAGLDYIQMDPFATGVFADGRIVRFHRDVGETVASIAEHSREDASAYRDFMRRAIPLVKAVVPSLDPRGVTGAARTAMPQAAAALRALARSGGPVSLGHDLMAPYGSLLQTALPNELTRAPVSSFASHSSAGPQSPGGSFFVYWQAAYHLYGQWHPRGGSQSLITALARRLEQWGGRVRTDAPVSSIDTRAGEVRSVTLDSGERIAASAVVSAIDVQTALLDLLTPALGGRDARQLAAAHRGNAVQFLVHLATDALPPYRNARPGDWNGLQSHVASIDQLRSGFLAAEAGRLPSPPPTYCFTPSVYDDSLAPANRHTVYLACPSAPARVEGGWTVHEEAFADAMVAEVEKVAPGFTASILSRSIRSPELMQAELRWPGAHPMYLDISLDQLAGLRPTRRLSRHTVPGIRGLFTCGASTAPVGGIAGSSGKAAARALLGRRGMS